MRTLNLLDLGTVDYKETWDFQKKLVAMRTLDQVPDTLLILEHNHVITLGRKTSPENFKPQNVPVYEVERGGDATYHGPGQLVGYPILKLEDHDVRKHMVSIENSIINTVRQFGVEGSTIIEGRPGVWVGEKKLASIGIAVTNWVSFHGFALNVNTDLSYFGLIKPCGFDPNRMTSMESLLGKKVGMREVKANLIEELARTWGMSIVVVPVQPNIN
jgi:lipoate-protein ligase B